MFLPFHFYPSLYFIVCLVRYFPHFIATQGYISLLAYFGVLVISLPPRAIFHCLPSVIFYPFHCYPGLYFIACLLWCFTHFIATQAYISLLVWCNILPISFLPRAIFHCLPTLVFYPFHCYLCKRPLQARQGRVLSLQWK